MGRSRWEQYNDIQELNNIIRNKGNEIEGNCLYKNNWPVKSWKTPFDPRTDTEDLCENLYKLGSISNNILEIGFNGGHSNVIFLLANPKAQIVNFDLCNHDYSKPCFEYLKSKYNVHLVKGDSTVEIPKYKTDINFDLIHIDGGHGEECATKDLINCKELATPETLLVFDDSNFEVIENVLSNFVNKKFIKEIEYSKLDLVQTPPHRIFKYVF